MLRSVLRLGALSLIASGCGLLAPSLYAPSVLAPDVVPPGDASAAVVTDQARGRGTEGRAIDRTTGREIAGVRLTARGASGGEASASTDARGAFAFASLAGLASLQATADCYLPLDARPAVSADSSAALLVLMAPAPCTQ